MKNLTILDKLTNFSIENLNYRSKYITGSLFDLENTQESSQADFDPYINGDLDLPLKSFAAELKQQEAETIDVDRQDFVDFGIDKARGGNKPKDKGPNGGGNEDPLNPYEAYFGTTDQESHELIRYGTSQLQFDVTLISNFNYNPYYESIYNALDFVSSWFDEFPGPAAEIETFKLDLGFEKWLGGGTLGGSYPSSDNNTNGLADEGTIILNPRYTDAMISNQYKSFTHLLAHELIHSLGFPGDDNWYESIDKNNDDRFYFNGSKANTIFEEWVESEFATREDVITNPVLENGGGSGTAGAHWESDEIINGKYNPLHNDLHIGYLDIYNAETQSLSMVTLGVLDDLGWDVNDSLLDTTNSNFIAFEGSDIQNYAAQLA